MKETESVRLERDSQAVMRVHPNIGSHIISVNASHRKEMADYHLYYTRLRAEYDKLLDKVQKKKNHKLLFVYRLLFHFLFIFYLLLALF